MDNKKGEDKQTNIQKGKIIYIIKHVSTCEVHTSISMTVTKSMANLYKIYTQK